MVRRVLRLGLLALGAGAAALPGAVPAPAGILRLPPRAPDAPGGAEFARRVRDLSPAARQEAALAQLRAGNVPDSLRQLVAIELPAPGGRGTITGWVTPDYLAIGSDGDAFYIPLGRPAALEAAALMGDFVLPTTRVVELVHRQAAERLEPVPLPPDSAMRSTARYLEHQRRIHAQRGGAGAGAGDGHLVAGHKKDLVLTRRLLGHPDRVAIFGWHHRDGRPIQPLSTVHAAEYEDYSHGVRLLAATVRVGDTPRSIYDVLADPELAPALSGEGTLPEARTLMEPPHRDE